MNDLNDWRRPVSSNSSPIDLIAVNNNNNIGRPSVSRKIEPDANDSVNVKLSETKSSPRAVNCFCSSSSSSSSTPSGVTATVISSPSPRGRRSFSDLGYWLTGNGSGDGPRFGIKEKTALILPLLFGVNKESGLAESDPNLLTTEEAIKVVRRINMSSKDRSHRKTLPVTGKRHRPSLTGSTSTGTFKSSSSSNVPYLDSSNTEPVISPRVYSNSLEGSVNYQRMIIPSDSDDEHDDDNSVISPISSSTINLISPVRGGLPGKSSEKSSSDLAMETMEYKFQQTRRKRQQAKKLSRGSNSATIKGSSEESKTPRQTVSGHDNPTTASKELSSSNDPDQLVSQISSALSESPEPRDFEPDPPSDPVISSRFSKYRQLSGPRSLFSDAGDEDEEEAEDSGFEFFESRLKRATAMESESESVSVSTLPGSSSGYTDLRLPSSRALSRGSLTSSIRPTSSELESGWGSQEILETSADDKSVSRTDKGKISSENMEYESHEGSGFLSDMGILGIDENRNIIRFEDIQETEMESSEPATASTIELRPKKDLIKHSGGVTNITLSGQELITEEGGTKSAKYSDNRRRIIRDHDSNNLKSEITGKGLIDDNEGQTSNDPGPVAVRAITIDDRDIGTTAVTTSSLPSSSSNRASHRLATREGETDRASIFIPGDRVTVTSSGLTDSTSPVSPVARSNRDQVSIGIGSKFGLTSGNGIPMTLKPRRGRSGLGERRSSSDPFGSIQRSSQSSGPNSSEHLKRGSITVPYSGITISRGLTASYLRPSVAGLVNRYEGQPEPSASNKDDDHQVQPTLATSTSCQTPTSLTPTSSPSISPILSRTSRHSLPTSSSTMRVSTKKIESPDPVESVRARSKESPSLPGSPTSIPVLMQFPISRKTQTRPEMFAAPSLRSIGAQVSPSLVDALRAIGVNTEIDMALMDKILDKILAQRSSIGVQTDERPTPKVKKLRDASVGTEKFSRERFSTLPETRSKYTQTDSSCLRTVSKAVSTEDPPPPPPPTSVFDSLPSRRTRVTRVTREPLYKVSKDVQTDLPSKRDAIIDIQVFSEPDLSTETETESESAISEESQPEEAVILSSYELNKHKSPVKTVKSIKRKDGKSTGQSPETNRPRDVRQNYNQTTRVERNSETRPISRVSSRTHFRDPSPDGNFSETSSKRSTVLEEAMSPGRSDYTYSLDSVTDQIEGQRSHQRPRKTDLPDRLMMESPVTLPKSYAAKPLMTSIDNSKTVESKKESNSTNMGILVPTNQEPATQPNNDLIRHPASQQEMLANFAKQLKTHSKVIVSVNNDRRREISEVTSFTEIGQDGKLSRKTQVSTIRKVPVVTEIPNHSYGPDDGQSNVGDERSSPATTQPVITSPILSKTTQSSPMLSPKAKKYYSHGTLSESSTRPSSALDMTYISPPGRQNVIPEKRPESRNDLRQTYMPTYSESDIDLRRHQPVRSANVTDPLHIVITEPGLPATTAATKEVSPPSPPESIASSPARSYVTSTHSRSASQPSRQQHHSPQGHSFQIIQPRIYSTSVGHKPVLGVTWEEASNSTICSEMSTEPFKDSDGTVHPPKSVSVSSETVIANRGKDTKVETRSRANRRYANDDIIEPDIKSETILSDSPPPRMAAMMSTSQQQQQPRSTQQVAQLQPKTMTQQPTILAMTSANAQHSKPVNLPLTRPNEQLEASQPTTRRPLLETDLNSPLLNQRRRPLGHSASEMNLFTVKNEERLGYASPASYSTLATSPKVSSGHIYPDKDLNSYREFDRRSNQSISPIREKTMLIESPQPPESVDSGLKADGASDLDMLATESRSSVQPELREISKQESLQQNGITVTNHEPKNELTTHQTNGSTINKNQEAAKSEGKGETEITTSLTKTTIPEELESDGIGGYKVKRPATSRVVMEQQLQSGDGASKADGCTISSSVTMESPYYNKMASMRDLAYSRKADSTTAEANVDRSELKPSSSMDSIPKKRSKSSHSYTFGNGSRSNEGHGPGEVITTSKFERHKSPQGRGREETTWEYSMECNCVNGVNTSLRTSVKHRRTYIPYACTMYESSV